MKHLAYIAFAALMTLAILSPLAVKAQSRVWQGGTGWADIAAGSILFGLNNLRLGTSTALQWNDSLSRLTVTNASTTALSSNSAFIGSSNAFQSFNTTQQASTTRVTPVLQNLGTSGAAGVQAVARFSSAQTGPGFYFGKSAGTSVGAYDAVSTNHQLGNISFQGADGTQFIEGAYIQGRVNGTVASGIVPTDIRFATMNSAGTMGVALVLNSESQGIFANGTEALPSVTFTGDPDTGFRRVTTDTIGVSTGGATIGRFNTVGLTIGSSAGATTTLHSRAAEGTNVLTLETTGLASTIPAASSFGKIDFYTSDGSGVGAGSAAQIRAYQQSLSGFARPNLGFFTADRQNADIVERMTIDYLGNVGIATTTPNARLTVDDGFIRIEDNAPTGFDIKNTNGTFRSALSIGSAGNPNLISNWSLTTNGQDDATKPSWNINLDSSVAGDFIAFRRAPAGSSTLADLFRFTSTGRFGIGTTSPGLPLSVAGSAYIGGNLTATGTVQITPLATAAGAFLAVDPSGNVIATTTPSGGLTGSAGQMAYFSGTNTAVGTSTITIASNSRVGIGTTTPSDNFSVAVSSWFQGLARFFGNILLSASSYINFGTTSGSSGYGFRDNSGTMEFKNSGGSWTPFSGSQALVQAIPYPLAQINGTPSGSARNTAANTSMYLGQVYIPGNITASSFTVRTGGNAGGGGNIVVALYSLDGQTRYFSETVTMPNTPNTNVTDTITSPVALSQGIYWVGLVGVTTNPIEMFVYSTLDTLLGVTVSPVMEGAYTVTAGTPPTTITPSSIVGDDDSTLYFRLDD